MSNFTGQRMMVLIGADPIYNVPSSLGGYEPNDNLIHIIANTREMGKGSVVLDSWTGWDDGAIIEYNSAQKMSGDGEYVSRYGSIKGRDISFSFSIHLSESQMSGRSMNNIKRAVDALSTYNIEKNINVYRWQSNLRPFHPETRSAINSDFIISPVGTDGLTLQSAVRERYADENLRYLGHTDYVIQGRLITFTLNFRVTDSTKKQIWTLDKGVDPLLVPWSEYGIEGI